MLELLILRMTCVNDRCAYFALGSIVNDYVKVVWLAYIASESSRIHTWYWYIMIFEPTRAWSLNHWCAISRFAYWAGPKDVSGVADEPIWNARMWYWNEHIGPGRELSATCEDHLWTHGGSKYFVRKPPLDPSSRYLLELVGMLVPCLHKTWTTASQLTPYPTIAVFTWHLVMNVL